VAIIITIMVLELRLPAGVDLAALQPLVPLLLSYLLSFVYLGIYWNNHHHMLHATDRVTGSMLWANLHLLFWLSLIPFTTHWLGEHHAAALPVATYGFVLFMASVAYFILQQRILATQDDEGPLRRAIGSDWKGKLSPLLYAAAIALAYASQWLAIGVYVLVALMWLVPDRRIERTLDAPLARSRLD
jgi:uncharacterized membrane protein